MNSFTNCTVTFNLNNKASTDKPRKRRFHFIESDSDRLNNSLNCLAGLGTFLRLKDVKISFYLIVLIVSGCFDRTHNVTFRV